ncbi:MAG: HAMP domain-containing histidine kinase [Elusimicrobia bacterium]|nr:HAMP domain-containing histidine kinase [Elusimicrobiota bacterium]
MKFRNKIVIGGLVPLFCVSAILFFTVDGFLRKIDRQAEQTKIDEIAENVEDEVNRHLSIVQNPLRETFAELISKLYSWNEINGFFIKFASVYPQIERIALVRGGKKIVEISKWPRGVLDRTPVNKNTSLSNIFWFNKKPFVNFEIRSVDFVVSGTIELASLFKKVNSFTFSPSGKIKVVSSKPRNNIRGKNVLSFPLLNGEWSFELNDDFSALSNPEKRFRRIFLGFMLIGFLISFAVLKVISDDFARKLGDFSSGPGDEFSAVSKKIGELEKKNKKLRELIEAQDSVGILGRNVSVIGHELRNPISAIKNALYFISTQISEDVKKSDVGKHLRIMKNETKMISHMIEDILTLSRIKPPLRTNCDINEILSEVVSVFGEDETLVEFYFEKGGIPNIKADVAEMRQVFSNLIKNSVEAITPPGKIFIRTSSAGKGVKVTIKDTGCGIPKSKLGEIFKPFYSTKSAGMGFGLATVRKIVEERHNGKISVRSAEGQFAEFELFFPAEG